jgi:hypothetical protein
LVFQKSSVFSLKETASLFVIRHPCLNSCTARRLRFKLRHQLSPDYDRAENAAKRPEAAANLAEEAAKKAGDGH